MSGGANAMFVEGYHAEVIKRWGRWKSDSFTYYLWNDGRAIASVGRGVINSMGLLEQLQRQSDMDITKRTEKERGRAGGGGDQRSYRGREHHD